MSSLVYPTRERVMVVAKIRMLTLTIVLRIAPASDGKDFYPLKLN
jgi:hypothetical protein